MLSKLSMTFLLLAGLTAAAARAELTEQEARGRAIYFEGASGAGEEIVAAIGDTGTEVPAAVMPCANCHGRNGRGKPEGGVYPSDLTWSTLTKSYSVERPGGRHHPPYTERLLKRAISMGVDPGGNRLHVAMPLYRMSHEDMEDLVAYIRRLGEDLDPGLSDDKIVLATLLPREGPLASLGGAIEGVLKAYFDDVNRQGGVYHRQLELRVEAAPEDAAARAAVLRRLVESDEVFALVGAFLPGAEGEIASLVEELEIPLVGPFTLQPQIDFFAPNPYVFYLLPGLEDLGRSLVSFADEGSERPRAAVLLSADPVLAAAGQAIADQAAELGWPEVRRIGAGAEAGELGEEDTVFLFAGGEDQAAFLRRAAESGRYPRVLLPGTLVGRGVFDAPAGFAGRIYAAYPMLPSNQDPRSLGEYQSLAERYGLPTRHVTTQIATLASARVLVEGLKQSGRELSRGRLVEVLEGLVELDTGLTPPVTYSPNRRVGLRGAYVLSVDLERRTLAMASGWIESP